MNGNRVGVIALIVTLLAHTGMLFYWGGKISTSLSVLNNTVADHEDRLRQVERRTP